MMRKAPRLTGSAALVAALLPLLASPVALGQDANAPAIEERVDVRIVQIPLSVVDPGADTRASVRGLTIDHLEVFVDGRALEGAARARMSLDEICGETVPGPVPGEESAPAAEPRPVLVIIDFNYLDTRGRHTVARAIEELAERPASGESYKIYSFARQLRLLTPGFTNDAAELRRTAEAIRATTFSRRAISVMAGLPGDARDAAADTGAAFGSDEAPEGPGQWFDDVRRSALGGSALTRITADSAATIEAAITESFRPDFATGTLDYDPQATVAAMESVMRAHSALPGRKILALFSSESFRLTDETLLTRATQAIADLARREGFAIWTADVEGLARQRGSGTSELLSAFAGDSGGDSLRRTSELGRLFDGARQQLSCYYLLSLPVDADRERAVRRDISVKIDTARYPDLWKLRVYGPPVLALPTPKDRLRDDRIAALMSPEDFTTPPLTVTIEYPREAKGGTAVPARFRVPLDALAWSPAAEGGVRARALFDGLVERETGRGVRFLCRLGSEETGPLELRMPREPKPADRFGLSIELWCAFEEEGPHTARGVVTDLESERIGAARGTVIVRRKPGETWRVDDVRLLAATGKDFVWRPGLTAARRDAERLSWVDTEGRDLASDDRIALAAVLCGPGTAKAPLPSYALLVRAADGSARVRQVFGGDAPSIGTSTRETPFCAPAMLTIEPFSLEPGSYALALVKTPEAVEAARELFETGAMPAEGTDVLALHPFSVGS